MKILCLPYTHTLSHISRPLAVALELKSRGHEVLFAGESTNARFISEQGFQVLPLHETDPGELYGNIREGNLRFVNNDEVERLVAADLELFRKVKPDLVLSDGRFSAPVSTQMLGLKHCAIVNVSSTEYRALPYIPFFEWLPHNISRHLDKFNLTVEMAVFDNTMRIFKDLCQKNDLKHKVTATNCLSGNDLTLLADIPEYFPTRNLPENYHYIGPLTWKSRLPIPSWWPPTEIDGRLVYITMGTTGVIDFFPKVYDLFKTSQYTALIATGGQGASLDNLEGKLYVADFVDGDMAMEASELVVCHGGNGTIYQALMHGRPVIGIPTIPDQKFNMRRVEDLGLGRMLSWKDFLNQPESLLALIDSVCSNKVIAKNVEEFKRMLITYNPAKQSADIIEAFPIH